LNEKEQQTTDSMKLHSNAHQKLKWEHNHN